jgi:hypothetical protein
MSAQQSVMALVGEMRLWVDETPPRTERSLTLPAAGGHSVVFHTEGYQQRGASARSLAGVMAGDIVAELRRRRLLSPENRTDPAKGRFESETGELYLDAPARFMSVDTPRFQGIAAPGLAAPVRLKDVTISRQTTAGNLFVASVEGERPIRSARRLVVGYVTNALNTDMAFDGPEKRRVIREGKEPVLLETGAFSLDFAHDRPESLVCYALDFSGRRGARLPVRVREGRASLACDTAALPEGATYFFEVVARDFPR